MDGFLIEKSRRAQKNRKPKPDPVKPENLPGQKPVFPKTGSGFI